MIDIKTGKEMSRGNFLKGGLAAIIASGSAPWLAGSANASVGGMMRNVGARNAAMFGGKSLTYDYEVESLTSDNVAYIDLGVKASVNDRWIIEFAAIVHNQGSALWGAANDSSRLATAWITSRGAIRYGGGGYFDVGPWWKSIGVKNELQIQSGTIVLNGHTASNSATFNDSYSTMNVYLFACNGFYSVGCTVWSLKRYTNCVLNLDLHPVVKNGEGFLHNRVNDAMFGNAASSGSFSWPT